MIYFCNIPRTTIADIIPVIVAGFDESFISPCMPKIAMDGTLYYDEHQQYVIDATYPEHPLKFREIEWTLEKLQALPTSRNVFIGSGKDHSEVLKDIEHVSITVKYDESHYPLIRKYAHRFNQFHPFKFPLRRMDRLLTPTQPAADFEIDLNDVFDKGKLIELADKMGIAMNEKKLNFVDTWIASTKI